MNYEALFGQLGSYEQDLALTALYIDRELEEQKGQPLRLMPVCCYCGRTSDEPCKCGQCKVVVYCSDECRIEHRSTHQLACAVK
jgi:hypothetical protein